LCDCCAFFRVCCLHAVAVQRLCFIGVRCWARLLCRSVFAVFFGSRAGANMGVSIVL
jgi:hypothetical protein